MTPTPDLSADAERQKALDDVVRAAEALDATFSPRNEGRLVVQLRAALAAYRKTQEGQ